MSAFTAEELENKFYQLSTSQQSIQSVSQWLIHHKRHYKTIVREWLKEMENVKPTRKLVFMYLANEVIQTSRKKFPEFTEEFATVLDQAFDHVRSCCTDIKTKTRLVHIIDVWEDRNVYDRNQIEIFRNAMNDTSAKVKHCSVRRRSADKLLSNTFWKKKLSSFCNSQNSNFDTEPIAKKRKVSESVEAKIHKPHPGDPRDDASDLIQAIQGLKNCPSTDAVIRGRIAQLPQAVIDSSESEKIEDLEVIEKLAKQLDQACNLVSDYNSRLGAELEDRKCVLKKLNDFTCAQREKLAFANKIMEERKKKLKYVVEARNKLKSHLENLPNLNLLPGVTGTGSSLAPLPSARDLLNVL